nr:hypothetical protein [Bartonella alsatica]
MFKRSQAHNKFRINHSESLLDMAKKLAIFLAFLSSLEIGKNLYRLEWQKRSLNSLSQQSLTEFKKLLERVCKKEYIL